MLKRWCLMRDLPYQTAYSIINSTSEILETKKQRVVIDALIADGLYVPEVDEGVSVSDQVADHGCR